MQVEIKENRHILAEGTDAAAYNKRFGEMASHSAETEMEIKNMPPKVFGSPLRQAAGRCTQAGDSAARKHRVEN